MAVRAAIAIGQKALLKESSVYSTHEPCIMCSFVIRHHAIPEIILGIPVPYVGGHSSKFSVLQSTEVPSWEIIPIVNFDVCEAECKNLNDRFQKKK